MKIALDDTTKMTVTGSSYSTVFFGLVFVLVGLGFAYMGYASGGLLVIGFCAIFVITGLWVVASALFTKVVLDKNYNKAYFSIKTLIKREDKEIDLGKIKELILECLRQSDGENGTRFVYKLNFVLAEGQNVVIDMGGQGGLTINGFSISLNPHQKRIEEAQKIADFLGVNMTFIPPPSFTDALKALKDGINQRIKQDKKEHQ